MERASNGTKLALNGTELAPNGMKQAATAASLPLVKGAKP